jgi:thymidine kinase
MGSLTAICGPMFSGKTEALLEIINAAEQAHKKVGVLKPAMDSRHRGWVVSHSGSRHVATEFSGVCSLVSAIEPLALAAIDEAQFLSPDAVEMICSLADGALDIAAAGLDLDFRGEPFQSMSALIDSAAVVKRLTAVCTGCGGVATQTQRFADGAPAPFAEPVVLVGGESIYQPRCERCYAAERLEVNA